jgi:hypothetical protein
VAWFFGGGAMLSVSRALGRRLFSTGDLAAGVEEGALLRGGVAAAGGRWRRSGGQWRRSRDGGVAQGKKGEEAVASLRGRRERRDLVGTGKKGIFC